MLNLDIIDKNPKKINNYCMKAFWGKNADIIFNKINVFHVQIINLFMHYEHLHTLLHKTKMNNSKLFENHLTYNSC